MIVPLTDPEILDSYNRDALGYRGTPAGLYRPADESEVLALVARSHENREPITPVAMRSTTTGSCVCHSGYLVSTEKMNRILSIDPDRGIAVAQPGINLAQFKSELESRGLFFPPDPTSEPDCTLGGAVATNASGARTLKYGATRRWIRRLRVAIPPGRFIELKAMATDKNAAGYYGFQDPIQFFIGSEGTLGIITEIEVRCLKLPAADISFYAFFPTEEATLAAVIAIRQAAWPVRCLEYFDAACLDLLRREKRVPLPARCGGMLFFEEEIAFDDLEATVERWLPRLESLGALVDDTMVGDTSARKREMKELRHAIPATLNEIGVRYQASGGGKYSSDWAVEFQSLPAVMTRIRSICQSYALPEVFCFGHVGNGNPHVNLLASNAATLAAAGQAVRAMYHLVAEWGGTISAEHGIGKVKKQFLPLFFSPLTLDWMRHFKKFIDPHGIMAPGNIFD